MIDKILQVKNETELNVLLQTEQENEDIKRLMKQGTPMSQVILAHKWGIGDCECSNCY